MGNNTTLDSVLFKHDLKYAPIAQTKPIAADSFVLFQHPLNKEGRVNPAEKTIFYKLIKDTPNPVVTEAEKVLQEYKKDRGIIFKITNNQLCFWCADTVNYIYERALGKNPFGKNLDGSYKCSTVSALREWGVKNNRYRSVEFSLLKEEDIQRQLKLINPGDIIIWKTPYERKIEGGAKVLRKASHTGIVQKIQDGSIYVIEGNANIIKKNKKGECLLVKNEKQGINGNQYIGDFQEVNRYDGMIVKKYNVQDLIESGYSGYIDMKNLNAGN